MTDTRKAGPGSSWFAVDIARIMRLPERLRTLWPHELMPRADAVRAASVGEGTGTASVGDAAGTASAGEAASDDGPGAGKGITETLMLGEPSSRDSRRGFDVLTAWLTGFAAELNLTRSRITIVISSGDEIAHLEVSLCEDICLAILVLRGEGLAEFAGFELLRRLRPHDLAQVTEELCALVEKDCVLTVTYLNEAKVAGMEFLHRVDGTWARPTLERDGETITVGSEQNLESNAVRILLATILTRLRTTEAQQPPTPPRPPEAQRSSTTGHRS
ncbi:hypothetical protein SAMN04489751_2210 [Brevibacterium sandarakinum]|uniref:Uncharacterized protein n=1 Tax=Brevibacterium sandarakinum TaxID=629680 RepID=A0A1H1SX25_BRESA|nr:hypothetical protein [Brevibacterium sandarakinum]SDS52373.1 hypothetical protein SAMN04489751_2210 [Brevibacterium sandarakinum]